MSTRLSLNIPTTRAVFLDSKKRTVSINRSNVASIKKPWGRATRKSLLVRERVNGYTLSHACETYSNADAEVKTAKKWTKMWTELSIIINKISQSMYHTSDFHEGNVLFDEIEKIWFVVDGYKAEPHHSRQSYLSIVEDLFNPTSVDSNISSIPASNNNYSAYYETDCYHKILELEN